MVEFLRLARQKTDDKLSMPEYWVKSVLTRRLTSWSRNNEKRYGSVRGRWRFRPKKFPGSWHPLRPYLQLAYAKIWLPVVLIFTYKRYIWKIHGKILSNQIIVRAQELKLFKKAKKSYLIHLKITLKSSQIDPNDN